MDHEKRILLADDDSNDVQLTLRALKALGIDSRVDVVNDGAAALDYLYCRGAFADRPPVKPVVIILDLKMPKVDGIAVLRQIKSDEAMQSIPVVMLTSSNQDSDVLTSYSNGTNAYVVKPVDFREYLDAVKGIGQFWGTVNQPPLQ